MHIYTYTCSTLDLPTHTAPNLETSNASFLPLNACSQKFMKGRVQLLSICSYVVVGRWLLKKTILAVCKKKVV
jgi:hypothetical protein